MGLPSLPRLPPGRRPQPLPGLLPLPQRHHLQPGDLRLRLVVQRGLWGCLWSLRSRGGAFGSSAAGSGGDSDAGECPAPSAGGDCAGAVSNCWSPGQRDTDCPNNGLCCFDGCADTCVDGPKPEPQPVQVEEEEVPAPLVPEPVEAETEVKPESEEPGYEYPVPEVPLELPKPSPPPPGLPTLYGAPPI